MTPNLKISGFADDPRITDSFKANDSQLECGSISEIKECMINIKSQMDQTRLKMSPFKTEFIYFGHPRKLMKYSENAIIITGDLILRSDIIRYLRVWIDSTLSFKQHTTKKCQVAIVNFIRIRNIHHLLDTDTTESICLSLCI